MQMYEFKTKKIKEIIALRLNLLWINWLGFQCGQNSFLLCSAISRLSFISLRSNSTVFWINYFTKHLVPSFPSNIFQISDLYLSIFFSFYFLGWRIYWDTIHSERIFFIWKKNNAYIINSYKMYKKTLNFTV
jgi:hypothetical protein